ncbi:unnamed protein product [Amoebophrya sp. A120]|nr:unnamed protein product [Amoebophrya sp. A120]|eukprot:GSA120T00009926001.1
MSLAARSFFIAGACAPWKGPHQVVSAHRVNKKGRVLPVVSPLKQGQGSTTTSSTLVQHKRRGPLGPRSAPPPRLGKQKRNKACRVLAEVFREETSFIFGSFRWSSWYNYCWWSRRGERNRTRIIFRPGTTCAGARIGRVTTRSEK